MKISYRTHPILEKLYNKSLGTIPVAEKDRPFFDSFGKQFVSFWKQYQPFFIKSVNYLSAPFVEAAKLASPKLLNLLKDIAENDKSDFNASGTYIFGGSVYMIHESFKKGSEDIETAFFLFTNEGTPVCFYVDNDDYHQTGWVSNCMGVKTGLNNPDAHDFIRKRMLAAIVGDMFKKYASIETKYIPANKKVKDINCKYVNDTDVNITHLDSIWFTNLVKSDAFKVRGHFRLQPKKKDGEWTKELIWITDFLKTGYTRQATKIREGYTEEI